MKSDLYLKTALNLFSLAFVLWFFKSTNSNYLLSSVLLLLKLNPSSLSLKNCLYGLKFSPVIKYRIS